MAVRLVEAVDLDFVLLAMRYTLLEQDAIRETLPLLTDRGIGVVAGSIFNSGILARAQCPERSTITPTLRQKSLPRSPGWEKCVGDTVSRSVRQHCSSPWATPTWQP